MQWASKTSKTLGMQAVSAEESDDFRMKRLLAQRWTRRELSYRKEARTGTDGRDGMVRISQPCALTWRFYDRGDRGAAPDVRGKSRLY